MAAEVEGDFVNRQYTARGTGGTEARLLDALCPMPDIRLSGFFLPGRLAALCGGLQLIAAFECMRRLVSVSSMGFKHGWAGLTG